MEEQLFTWEALSAMGGASLLTFLIVAYTKSLVDRIAPKLPTDLYSVLVASVVLIVAQIAMSTSNASDWRVYVLGLFNGFLVALAAGKMDGIVQRPPGSGKENGE